MHRGSHKEDISPKRLTGETKGAGFLQQWSSKTVVLDICAMADIQPSRCSSVPVEKKGRGPGANGAEDLLGCTGRDGSSLEHNWKRWHCFLADKRASRHHYTLPLLSIGAETTAEDS